MLYTKSVYEKEKKHVLLVSFVPVTLFHKTSHVWIKFIRRRRRRHCHNRCHRHRRHHCRCGCFDED
jgi:hypothetical protein